jgi:exportin-1
MLASSLHDSPRRQMYAPILTKVRIAIILRMARPEEVLVTEDDNGNLIRQYLKDTDAIALYNNMRETLVYLTHLDPNDTVTIMESKLSQQVCGWRPPLPLPLPPPLPLPLPG